ncbi:MAG: hypothetical protein ABI355_12340 [Solirubrobacteraceae bacterium]
MPDSASGKAINALAATGMVRIPGPFARSQQAWSAARVIVDGTMGASSTLAVIGDFVLPPADGPSTRDFQTLHLDFGLPLVLVAPADVARFTALHISAGTPASTAATRLVPLSPLLGARAWPDRAELVRRFAEYGRSHGAWDDAAGYCEGSFARIVEGALGTTPVLPSVKEHAGFLCGNEFASLADEREFFARRGLCLNAVEIELGLSPGELLVFNNLTHAHGRRGVRRPGELNQRVYGHPSLPVEQQVDIRDAVLAAFAE